MQLTFVNDLGQTYSVDIDPDMELENVMALLEAESGIPINEQSISHEGRELNNTKATMKGLGVRDNAMLLLRRKINVGGRRAEQDAETIRLQILGDPQLLRQLEETQPEVAAAVRSNPQRFAQLLRELNTRRASIEQQRLVEIERLNADPFDVEAQRKIEEAIRQEAVLENLDHALEYSPESFGRVTMLYIPVEVNGHPVKAFVDSGAQQTIMSPECAEACGIMRLVDERFSGIARGVGTAKILGRVHSAQLKLSDLFLPCAITIMEGRDVDLLFGLDMLKAHQACIDLEKNVLRIQNREVRFLSEHELPEKHRLGEEEVLEAPVPTAAPPRAPDGGFSGSGRTLGASPAAGPSRSHAPQSSVPAQRYPERDISTLMDLGVSREVAISTLEAAGGNVDVAASLLF
jgi:DNA damage-inducible protein 1